MWLVMIVLMLRGQIEVANDLVLLLKRENHVARDDCVDAKGTD